MSEQHPQYQVGDVANGHRWTGTTWEPVGSPDLQGQEQPVQPSTTQPNKAWYKKWWGIGIIAFGALVLIVAIFGGGGDTAGTNETTTETSVPEDTAADDAAAAAAEEEARAAAEEEAAAAAEEEAAAAAAVAGVGDPVRDGKFEFTVTDVERGQSEVGSEYLSETAQGEYTLVSMKIENIGDEAQTFFSDNVKGTDSKGRELGSDSTATLYANEDNTGWIEEINPGNSIEAIIVFDVAKGEELVAIIVQDSAFSGGAEISLK